MAKYILVLLLILPLTSHAYLTSDFDFGWGYSSIKVDVGGYYNRDVESLYTLEFSYNLKVSGPDLAITLSAMEMLKSKYGDLPLVRFALGVRWYPRGLNGAKTVMDSQVTGRLWKPSPFASLNFGISTMSIQETSATEGDQGFNASIIDGQFGLGVEIPVAANWLLLGQFKLLNSLISNEGEGRPSLTYTGYQLFAGVKATPF